MPRQNRVTPFSTLEVSPARGAWYGNRGCLHNGQQQIVRPARRDLDRWLICVLEFKGRRRQLFQPGRFTELFFLDEVTAFAAGHRPCVECRRADALRFIQLVGCRSARELDERLAVERRAERRTAPLGEIPDGAMLTLSGNPGCALLRWNGNLWKWSHFGYERAPTLPEDTEVSVLTPKLACLAFTLGYKPQVHSSAIAEARESSGDR